jgi:hypothetical protein
LGLLYFHIFEAVFELVNVVEPHGNTEYALEESTHKLFVSYPDLEVDWSSMLASVRQNLCQVSQVLKEDVQAIQDVDGVFF